ncbi:hypothetical protein ABZ755_26915 [Streptomyces griseoincarnatus]
MYWLFADETNTQPSQGTFFIYGGLIASADQIVQVHESISRIRREFGFKDSDQFKFQTASRPDGMSIEDWSAAKKAALEAAQLIGVEMLAYVVHHGIAKSGNEVTMEYALNTLVAHFNFRYLAEKDSFGALCIDRLDEAFGYRYMRERFQTPLSVQGRKAPLERVIHYSMTCDGASHMSSVVDLAIGGFRYCVNSAMGAGKEEVARDILKPIAKMMWSKERDGKNYIGEYGLVKRPVMVMVDSYREDYEELTRVLTSLSNEAGDGPE